MAGFSHFDSFDLRLHFEFATRFQELMSGDFETSFVAGKWHDEIFNA